MYFDPAAVITEFKLPESLVPAAMLIFGSPADDAAPADRLYQRLPREQLMGGPEAPDPARESVF
jgi:nitroreductase